MEVSNNAKIVLEKRYLTRNDNNEVIETPSEMFSRVASYIAQADPEETRESTYNNFIEMLSKLDFLPNSPTLMNAAKGTGQLAACFVLPIDDSVDDIFKTIKDTAAIHKSGGGTGFSFSRLRPKNDLVSTTSGTSSGPVSFMTVFDTATEAIKQGGTRRGANMGVLRVDHPDILEFINSKIDKTKLTNFNISVAITDKFMRCLLEGEEFLLVNPRDGKVVQSVDPKEIFNAIVENVWIGGEPGLIFIDEINRWNKLRHVQEIESTNPCGEQPLLPYESCNLGSINLAKMIRASNDGQVEVDYTKLENTTRTAVHFLDNVIDMNLYPLEIIKTNTLASRKIGLGVMGFADLLALMGIPYDSEEALTLAENLMFQIRSIAIDESEQRGKLLGFPQLFSQGDELSGPRRNVTVTTIAPTGSISIIANCSSGIEPFYALVQTKNVLDGEALVEINPVFELIAKREGFYSEELIEELSTGKSLQETDIPDHWKNVFKCAHEIKAEQHLKIQASFQEHTCNAVSKTINLPKSATKEDVREAYMLAYKLGCKGVTIYRDGTRSNQVLQCGQRKLHDPIVADQKVHPRGRPDVVKGKTRRMTTGCGNLYITINEDDEGLVEVFTAMGKAGGCASSQAEAISRLISLCLRSKIDTNRIIKQLKQVRCPSPAWEKGGGMVLSCADAIAKALERHIGESNQSPSAEDSNAPACPECGNKLKPSGGCFYCDCGYSRC